MKLEVEGLTAGYEGTPVIRDVDCTVEDGEVVGIMGKNGVGKTTLMKTIMGLLTPYAGTIRVDDQVLVTDDKDEIESQSRRNRTLNAIEDHRVFERLPERAQTVTEKLKADNTVSADKRASMGIGYVPQGRDVFPGLTVKENLLMGEDIGGDDEVLYEHVYDLFPILKERADQDAATMSGGQQQMLAIGRALVGGPDLLLVDEPSEGVQPSIVQSITENLASINDELGTTILFVEQNLSVVQGLADRCYAMDKGTIVDELRAHELQDREHVAEHLAV